ncbi:MAG: sugar transferase [Planctomycetota bacterium]
MSGTTGDREVAAVGMPSSTPRDWERSFREQFARELLDRYAPQALGTERARIRADLARWRAELVWSRRSKRWMDVLGASLLLMIALPVLLAAAIAIRLEDWGPVLYRQRRVGQGGREFTLYKLRSMGVAADHEREQLQSSNEMEGVIFKMRSDPRATRVGRLLRRYSVDELPQLWNVLRGEMSLVGPRPPLPAEVEHYTLLDRTRLEVKPGLTCYWQVMGRSELGFARQVELDLDYIHNQSVATDLWILLRTIPAVLSGRGAY